MTEEKKSFIVKDRRHFTAEGETRDEAAEPEKPEAREPARSRPEETAGDAGHRPGLDFAGLLLSLGAQASMLLGLGDEDEPGAAPDLQGAQAIISLLEVLREKTEGRRTPDEDRILEGILYELRMAYVAGTRAGGA
jgi:uncharacterized protein DUF1844